MEEWDEVEVPDNVKEIFVEMKNTAELMVDLAYSAVLFREKEMAEEVLELEEYLDLLNYNLTVRAVLSARNLRDAERITSILQMGHSIDEISNAAADLAKMVIEEKLHPLINEVILESEETIGKAIVSPESVLVGKTLEELDLPTNTGVWVIAIRRGKRWLFDPDEDTGIMPGDILIGRGTRTALDYLKELARGVLKVMPNG
ncbi:potassium channel family protein [Thermococcus sp. Bubb.Bath]|uniref:potassium channel family protein n=1 Tax=Thermococcus sp. Bubb.Bath TaxID=1638242 RepID=UPI00143B34E6|nr:TrkA C-terminal domain-containing protein [Thermococcus sp. Bubb.Bath]NJF25911.1 potassium channel protein [Thermococcus sp. Bubb.Bath]